MRVTDQLLFTRVNAQVARAREESVSAGDEVSSGKKLVHAWDNAGDAGLVSRFSQEKARQDSIFSATQRASEELGAVDGAFDNVINSITRAQELAVQLSNDTYSAADRANGGAEVQQLIGAVISQLNVKFGDRYLFAGMNDRAPPFSAAGAYTGDANVRTVEIAPGVYQDASVRADQAFKGVGGGIDITTALQDFATALSTNNATNIRAATQSLADGLKQVTTFRSRAGAMMNVFDLASNTARLNRDAATDGQSHLEDADIFDSSIRLTAAQRALDATMSATAQSFKLTLLNKL